MKNFILLFCIFGFTITGYAQNLKPNNSVFELYKHQSDYYSKIKTKLFESLKDNQVVQLVVKPSFSSEYVFQIEKKNDSFFAKVNIASENIWYSKDFESIEVKSYTSTIGKKDVDLLSKVYLKMIEKVHYPVEIENIIGADGVTYNFSVSNLGLKSGTIWSPNDSINKTIIEISEKLIENIKSKESVVSLREEDRTRLENCYNELNRTPDLNSYNLMVKMKKLIEQYKPPYLSKLSKNHTTQTENLLFDFEKIMLQQLAYNRLDMNFVNELLRQCDNAFFIIIEHGTSLEDTDNIDIYKNNNKADNIFQKIRSELYQTF